MTGINASPIAYVERHEEHAQSSVNRHGYGVDVGGLFMVRMDLPVIEVEGYESNITVAAASLLQCLAVNYGDATTTQTIYEELHRDGYYSDYDPEAKRMCDSWVRERVYLTRSQIKKAGINAEPKKLIRSIRHSENSAYVLQH